MNEAMLRPVTDADEEVLWAMLFLAAHADEQPGATPMSVRTDPDLQRYVVGWGRAGDRGVIAVERGVDVGAAWLRRFAPHETHLVTFVAPEVPELAIAVAAGFAGRGLGSAMLVELLAQADRAGVPEIVLSVRATNPALRLYERFGFVAIDRIVNRVGTESVKMLRRRPT